jgi:hypothetical protein
MARVLTIHVVLLVSNYLPLGFSGSSVEVNSVSEADAQTLFENTHAKLISKIPY